jgi:hypothetical protein
MHGLPDSGGDLYFLAHDTDPNQLVGTGLPQRDVEYALGNAQATRIVMLMDACHAGQVMFWGTAETFTPAGRGNQVGLMDHMRYSSVAATDALMTPDVWSYSTFVRDNEIPSDPLLRVHPRTVNEGTRTAVAAPLVAGATETPPAATGAAAPGIPAETPPAAPSAPPPAPATTAPSAPQPKAVEPPLTDLPDLSDAIPATRLP